MKKIFQLQPGWQLVVFDPANAVVVLDDLCMEPFLEPVQKSGEGLPQSVHKWVGLAN